MHSFTIERNISYSVSNVLLISLRKFPSISIHWEVFSMSERSILWNVKCPLPLKLVDVLNYTEGFLNIKTCLYIFG